MLWLKDPLLSPKTLARKGLDAAAFPEDAPETPLVKRRLLGDGLRPVRAEVEGVEKIGALEREFGVVLA
jgi:hypothetical protein